MVKNKSLKITSQIYGLLDRSHLHIFEFCDKDISLHYCTASKLKINIS